MKPFKTTSVKTTALAPLLFEKMAVVLISALFLCSCGNTSNSNKNVQIGDTTNSRSQSNIIVRSLDDGLTLIYTVSLKGGDQLSIGAFHASAHDKYFLDGDTNTVVAQFVSGKDLKTDTLLTNEFTYTEIDSSSFTNQKINGKAFQLLTIKESFKGQAITSRTINFILIDPTTKKHYFLQYQGESTLRCEVCIDGAFLENEALESVPEIKTILYAYARKSKWIYRTEKAAEKNPRHMKNYELKWEQDNEADNHLANGHSGIPDTIYSTYYKDDLMKFTEQKNGEPVTIEDNRFLVSSYFRGNLLGFDKQKKLFFPIFIESCVTGCNKTIRFISSGRLEVIYDEDTRKEVYTIDLNGIKFL